MSLPESGMPTVVVSRRAREGRGEQLERWLLRLVELAAEAPGYVGAEVQRPIDDDSSEWIVIYRFETATDLRNWLASPERTILVAEGDALVDGEAREQVVVLQREIDPVTAVISFRVRPEHRDDYAELHTRIGAAMSRAPGFVRTELFEPVEGVQEETVVVFTFDGRSNLEAWLESGERHEILEQMSPYVIGSRTVNVVDGFGGWFDLDPDRAPKRWKQATVVLLALYPTVMLLTMLNERYVPEITLPVNILLSNIASVSILTWLLMPRLTRLLADWLHR
jgi:antibiotic biosynthesis monooxygenase (ABM) superfamily enzyme